MKVGKAVIDAVGKIAPAVAGAMGGPGAARVTQQVSQVLTGRPDASEDDIRAQVENLTEPQAAALSALDEQITARERIAAEDRAHARDVAAETSNRTAERLAYLDTFLLAGLILLIVLWEPERNSITENILFVALGSVVTVFKQGRDHFMGSSTGSKSKDGTISRLISSARGK